eukprot:m.113958 g.113958  ORF g.113958 m.113958 type:complete len:1243 (+) comp9146_c0_seq2:231-3959(+)
MESLGFQALDVPEDISLASIVVAAMNAAGEGVDVQLIVPICYFTSAQGKKEPPNTDSFIRSADAHLESRVTPRVILTSTWAEGLHGPLLYVHPTPLPPSTAPLLCRLGSPQMQPPEHASLCSSLMGGGHESSCYAVGASVYIYVPTRAMTAHIVYSVNVKYRFIAGVTAAHKELWPGALASIRALTSWLKPTPKVQTSHSPETGAVTMLPASASCSPCDSAIDLLRASCVPQSPAPIAAIPESVSSAQPTRFVSESLTLPEPSLLTDMVGSDGAASSTGLILAPVHIDCPCRTMRHDGPNREEEGAVEYKEVFVGVKQAAMPTLKAQACFELVRDHILPMMRTWPAGHLCIGIADAMRVVAPFLLTPGTSAKAFLANVAMQLDRFFQGVFPPLPRDATLLLCLVQSAQSPGFVLQFSYIFRTTHPELLRAIMHDGTNTVYTIAIEQQSAGPAAGSLFLRRDHPLDLWQQARSDLQPGEGVSARAKAALGDNRYCKLLLASAESLESLNPILQGIVGLSCLPSGASPLKTFKLMQETDALGDWLVIACCRTSDETQATWAALSSIPSDFHFSILLVTTTFAEARVAVSEGRSDWIVSALRQRESLTLIDIAWISPPTLRARLEPQPVRTLSESSAALHEALSRGYFTVLQPCVDVNAEVAAANARNWLETGAPITGDVVKHHFVVCPQADNFLPPLLQSLQYSSKGNQWLHTLVKTCNGYKLEDRCVGATTTMRVLAYRALDAVPDLCVLEPAHSQTAVPASVLVDIIERIAARRPLLIIDDDCDHHSLVNKLLACGPPGQFVYLRVQSRSHHEDLDFVQLSSMISTDAASHMAAVLTTLYPRSEAVLRRIVAKQRELHFLQYVLSAIHNTPVLKMKSWVRSVLTKLRERNELTMEICSRLSGMAFLCCFDTTRDPTKSYAWVPHEYVAQGLGSLFRELFRGGHGLGLLRRQSNRFCFYHPLIALELLHLLVSPNSDVFLANGLMNALNIYPDTVRGHVLRRLCVDRAGANLYFSSLVLYASCELKWDHEKLANLFQEGLKLVAVSEVKLLAAHLLVVQSRYVRRSMDHSLSRTRRKEEAFMKHELALTLAEDALDRAREAIRAPSVAFNFLATATSACSEENQSEDGRLFVFHDTIAWAHVKMKSFSEASEIFELLYGMALNDARKKTVLQKVRAALPPRGEDIQLWCVRLERLRELEQSDEVGDAYADEDGDDIGAAENEGQDLSALERTPLTSITFFQLL